MRTSGRKNLRLFDAKMHKTDWLYMSKQLDALQIKTYDN